MGENESKTLSRVFAKSELIIMALLSSKNNAEACEKAGISETSLYRLFKDESFMRQLYDAKRKMLEVAIIKLQSNCNEAVMTLIDVMNDEKTPPSVRVMSARAILEMTLKLTENDELLRRVEALEDVINV